MAKSRITVTIDERLLRRLDALVERSRFADRSHAIETAVEQFARSRLAAECARLDPEAERAMAEEGLAGDAESWPE